MRVACYVRVSSREQAEEGYSLAAQEVAIRAYCAQRGWDDLTFHADEGISAFTDRTADRPAFAAMLDAAERGEYQLVIVHKLDRFARSLMVTLRELKRLKEADVAFVSIGEQMDFSTPIGTVILSVLASFAQYYSENLSAESRKGLAEKRRQGKFVGRPPYGAKRIDGYLTIDPDRAEDLRQALELAATLSPVRAAEELNARGIRPSRHAKAWGPSAVHVLRTDAGAWLLGQGEPWATLYTAAASRPAKPIARRDDTIRMLSSLLRCVCGGSLTYHSTAHMRDGTIRRHGRCRDAEGRQGCHRWGRNMNQVEAAVERWLFALPDPRELVALPDDANAAAALDERRRRVARLYRDGIMSEAEYDREKAALQRDLSRIPASTSRREELGVGLVIARAEWPNWGDETRRAFLAGLVDHFIVEDGDVRPVWRPTVAAIWEGM
ncbi:MAG TPA: recombinase family protein [Thermomicrobiales bacterium]|jgi:DNA invertase Pin-like site-specific DNA recombinase